MSAEWEELLQPISPDRPCGEDLEYTVLPAFDAHRLFGKTTSLEPPPAWGEIRNSALDALKRTKDLRLLAHLGTAALRTDGLPAFAQTLSIASEWLTAYWPQLFPLVDEDAMLRRNALNCFADRVAVIDALRRLPLVANRQHGTFSLRDIEIASGQMQPADGDARPDDAQIGAAFAAMPLEELSGLQRSAQSAVDALKRIDATMAAEGGRQVMPELEPLSSQLSKVDRVLRSQLALRADAPPPESSESGVDAGGVVVAVGAIKSRQDAVRALDAVAEYFRRNEPSSPIPLFVERAKRLVSKSFLEVLADVVPDAVGQARAAGGVPENQ
jgi:type VI secretion system protein ImpA